MALLYLLDIMKHVSVTSTHLMHMKAQYIWIGIHEERPSVHSVT